MEINDNILTGYCFLAALTENENDLYNHVFVPICKRALSLYSLRGATHGNSTDIKNLIQEEYGIDIPTTMVRKLINSTYKSLSNKLKEQHKFKVLENGNYFELDKYSFAELEIKYKKGQRNAKAIQTAFEAFLADESIDKREIPAFSDFLNKNKKHLARFFKSNESINGENIDKTYIHHVQFLEYIETNNHELFEIAQGLYVGSIVASFLEAGLDLEPKFENKEIYYLDTPVILKALDLQKEEETIPIKELIDLIRKTGGELKILSITIDEIRNVVENAITNYNAHTPSSTINEACLRLRKNKAWLINFNGKIEQNITDELKAKVVPILPSFKEKNIKSNDVKSLQNTRLRKGNALHDVLAYLFIREQRGGTVNSFQKARIWFLTSNSNLLAFNLSNNPAKGISEIVLPDALTSLLWLKAPSKLFSKVKSIGLAELMANTLNEEIASKELINEFEANISTLTGISHDDYKILLESVAHQSAKMIDHLNEIIVHDKEKAKVEAHKIVERENTRKIKLQKTIKDAQVKEKLEKEKGVLLSNKNIELTERLATIEKQLLESNNTNKTTIEELSEKIELQAYHINSVYKAFNKTKFAVIFGAICIIVFFSLFLIEQKITEAVKEIAQFITALGGLWGFGSFIINTIKFSKGK